MKVNSKDKLAVKGFDVVAFFSGEASKGNPSISHESNGVDYYFKSERNRDRFAEDPSSFLPEYGGFCSIAMSEGTEVDPNPKSFKIQDGKLYLFTRMFWGIIDVQRQWNKDPEGKRKLADMEWGKLNK